MKPKRLRYALLGLLAALAIAMGLLILAEPKAEVGSLEFLGFRDHSGIQKAVFAYRLSQKLTNSLSVRYTCVDVETGASLQQDYLVKYDDTLPVPSEVHIAVVPPKTVAWRLKAAPLVAKPTTSLRRLRNVLAERRLAAWDWQYPLTYNTLPPVYSRPITNPVPSTVSP